MVSFSFPSDLTSSFIGNGPSNRHPPSNTFKEKVCIIGSGNWGSAIATIIGKNCQKLSYVDSKVNMWVFDEKVSVDGEDNKEQWLSDVINTHHENVKYLPGVELPKNVIAVPDLKEAIQNATLLVFVLPHQFLPSILPKIKEVIDRNSENDATKCRGISLIKGLEFDRDTKLPISISDIICTSIGNNFKCGVLMGANVAKEIALGQFSESTLATNFGSPQDELTHLIFHSPPTFRVQVMSDIYGAETCGALKNVIALGAGFVDALQLGGNTKAALLRIGLREMKQFCKIFFDNIEDSTFLESCGLADLITTCYGGRNRLCAEAFAKLRIEDNGSNVGDFANPATATTTTMIAPEKCMKRWNKIEDDLLNGQKLQGTLTCKDVYLALQATNMMEKFPLMRTIYGISFEGKPLSSLIEEGIIIAPFTTSDEGRSNVIKNEKMTQIGTPERDILVKN